MLINPQSNKPLYEQLILGIKEQILHGILQPGDRLPSIRDMAKELLVNPNTVSKAYRFLEMEQIIITVKGKGTFVKEMTNLPRDERRIQDLQAEFKDLVIRATHLQVTTEEMKTWLDDLKESLGGNYE